MTSHFPRPRSPSPRYFKATLQNLLLYKDHLCIGRSTSDAHKLVRHTHDTFDNEQEELKQWR
jgi:hypothetical protein